MEVPVKRIVLVALLGLLALSLVPQLRAQGVGSVRGNVTDEHGAVVAEAEVSITNLATSFSRTVASDANGN